MKTEKITQFTGANLDLLRKKVEAALTVIGESYNVKFQLGRITYSPTDNTASAKLKFEARTAEGKPVDRERLAWTPQNCQRIDLKFEWLDQIFTSGQAQYKITGLDLKRDRCVVTVRVSDGVSFSWDPIAILKFFDPQAAQDRLIKEARNTWSESSWDFELDRKYAGLKSDWLNKTFEAPSHLGIGEFKVEGLQRSKSQPIVVISCLQNGEVKIKGISVPALVSVAAKKAA